MLPPGDFLKVGTAFADACSTRTHVVGYVKPSKKWRLEGIALAADNDVLSRCSMGVLGSESNILDGEAGGEGRGSSGLGCLES